MSPDYGRPCRIESNQFGVDARFIAFAQPDGKLWAVVEQQGGVVAHYDITAHYSIRFTDRPDE